MRQGQRQRQREPCDTPEYALAAATNLFCSYRCLYFLPLSIFLCLDLSPSVSICLPLSLCLSVSVSLSLCLSLSLSLYLAPSLSPSIYVVTPEHSDSVHTHVHTHLHTHTHTHKHVSTCSAAYLFSYIAHRHNTPAI